MTIWQEAWARKYLFYNNVGSSLFCGMLFLQILGPRYGLPWSLALGLNFGLVGLVLYFFAFITWLTSEQHPWFLRPFLWTICFRRPFDWYLVAMGAWQICILTSLVLLLPLSSLTPQKLPPTETPHLSYQNLAWGTPLWVLGYTPTNPIERPL